ncbi:MAG: antibiotic biosynthesis monooxygenase, partial [Pseudomonadota bacterium]
FLFEVHPKAGYPPERYARAWVEASRIIQQSPGARGTRLHRSLDRPGVLLAIASWESKAVRDAMESQQALAVKDIIAGQAEFVEVRLIGEFDDPEWEVIPDR